MYKKPPEDDESREYSEFTYPPQQGRVAAAPKRPPVRYRTDEHPEVPRIRRQSLYHDQQHTQRPYNPALDDKTEEYKNTRLPKSSHKPAVIIIVVITLIIVIIVPIITYFGHNHITITAHLGSTTSNHSQPAIRRAPANQHELIIVPQDTDHPPPPVFATSAYLLDADTGVTLYAYNPFMHLPMLSTTKLMTASMAAAQSNLNQRITISSALGRDISPLRHVSATFGIKPR